MSETTLAYCKRNNCNEVIKASKSYCKDCQPDNLRISQKIWNDIHDKIEITIDNNKRNVLLSCSPFFNMNDEEFKQKYLND